MFTNHNMRDIFRRKLKIEVEKERKYWKNLIRGYSYSCWFLFCSTLLFCSIVLFLMIQYSFHVMDMKFGGYVENKNKHYLHKKYVRQP